mgnify:CR=1 FL=1
MSNSERLALWVPFVVASLATVIVYVTLWSVGWYWILLFLLGVLCGFFAARILARSKQSRWSVWFVVLGLVLGQWWVIEHLATQAIWQIRGFGP